VRTARRTAHVPLQAARATAAHHCKPPGTHHTARLRTSTPRPTTAGTPTHAAASTQHTAPGRHLPQHTPQRAARKPLEPPRTPPPAPQPTRRTPHAWPLTHDAAASAHTAAAASTTQPTRDSEHAHTAARQHDARTAATGTNNRHVQPRAHTAADARQPARAASTAHHSGHAHRHGTPAARTAAHSRQPTLPPHTAAHTPPARNGQLARQHRGSNVPLAPTRTQPPATAHSPQPTAAHTATARRTHRLPGTCGTHRPPTH
jgi:hypothetical protein